MSDKAATSGEDRRRDVADPAPYAYLDDKDRMAGPVSPGLTSFVGGLFLVGTLAVVIVSFAYDALPGLWIALGWGLLGGQLLRMGLARRAWRLRNPGVDPLSTVPSPTGGSAYGPNTRSASVGRWVLLVLCLLLGLLFVVALVDSFVVRASVTPTTVGSQILLALLSILVLSVARYDLRRIRQLRAQPDHGRGDTEGR